MDILFVAWCIGLALSPILLLILYIQWNDSRLAQLPPRARFFSPKRCTPQDVHVEAERLAAAPPIEDIERIPPKTGRRYIVIGGGGFLGGWIVTKLLERGEDFHCIRLLNRNPPTSQHYIVKDALSKGTQFFKVDITDPVALQAAFNAPWPDVPSSSPSEKEPEITVFHTAASVRFYERHISFLGRSSEVNVQGTKNVVSAAQSVGATVLVYTSTASIGIRNTRFLLWPWEKEPGRFVQVVDDNDAKEPRNHEDFCSNYTVSKLEAEKFVRASDKKVTGKGTTALLRTGCLRPGMSVYGPRGNTLSLYLSRRKNPSYLSRVAQSSCFVENCVAAHLLYEQRLIELLRPESKYPDIGGQAFTIADSGPTPTYKDMFTILETLTKGECQFPSLSPTAMLLIAHAVELYYRAQQTLSAAGRNWLPRVNDSLVKLQPSLFSLTLVHVVLDDSRARLPPEKGGLGYIDAWTTMEGLYKTIQDYKSGAGHS